MHSDRSVLVRGRALRLCALVFAIITSFLTSVDAQVIIRERVEIVPDSAKESGSNVQRLMPSFSVQSETPLLRVVSGQLETAVPGVEVSVSGMIQYERLLPGDSLRLGVSIGGRGYQLQRIERGCGADSNSIGNETFAAPPTVLADCGSKISVGFVRRYSCTQNYVQFFTMRPTGEGTTFVVEGGDSWYRARVTVTVGIAAGYEPVRLELTPETVDMRCNASRTITVKVYNGRGELYEPCPSTVQVRAQLQAGGAYAYLRYAPHEGEEVRFPLWSSGSNSFTLRLDTARGIIPGGYDEGRITVTALGLSGTATAVFRCEYPVPTVRITKPSQDTVVLLTATNQPMLTLQETHTPGPGQQHEPTIAWEPSQTIDTRQYFDQITDSLVLTVTVKAENAGGRATDTRKITLKKKGCEGPPCPSEMHPPTISLTGVGRDYPKLASDPCASEEARRSGGLFRALRESEEPVAPFRADVCFDPALNVWKFSVASLSLRVLLTICQEALEARGFRVIESVDQIPDAEACDALFDLANHYRYPVGARSGGFILRPVLLAHEQVHRQQFERHLYEARKEGTFDQSLRELTLPCEGTNSVEEARQKGEEQIRDLTTRLMKAAQDRMARERRRMGNENFEQMTQDHKTVRDLIDEASKKLESRCKF